MGLDLAYVSRLRDLIAGLADAFPRQPITEATLRVYIEDLADLPPDALASAARDLRRTSEFFPTIRALREATAERLLSLPGEAEALAQIEAQIAWTRQGKQSDPPALHPTVKEALDRVGGFYAFRRTEEPTVVRGQFLRLYRDLRGRAILNVQLDARRELEAA